MALMVIGEGQVALLTGTREKISHMFGLRASRNPKAANLATLGKHRVSQGE